jgi:hypothetical protein
LGWSYDDHTEFFTMQDLIEKFSLEKLIPSPQRPIFQRSIILISDIKDLSGGMAKRLQPYTNRRIHAGLPLLEKLARSSKAHYYPDEALR